MKMMKPQKYADGGMVEKEDAATEAMEHAYTGSEELCRQKVGAPNEREWNQGPGVRSLQDYGKKK